MWSSSGPSMIHKQKSPRTSDYAFGFPYKMGKDLSGTTLPPFICLKYIAGHLSLSKRLAEKGTQTISIWIAKRKTEPRATMELLYLQTSHQVKQNPTYLSYCHLLRAVKAFLVDTTLTPPVVFIRH